VLTGWLHLSGHKPRRLAATSWLRANGVGQNLATQHLPPSGKVKQVSTEHSCTARPVAVVMTHSLHSTTNLRQERRRRNVRPAWSMNWWSRSFQAVVLLVAPLPTMANVAAWGDPTYPGNCKHVWPNVQLFSSIRR
jgi:hypothetical protein